MSTNNNLLEKQFSRKFSYVDPNNMESPQGRKSDISKISENIKLLSNEINYHKRASMNNNMQVNEIISNLFDKDKELLELNRKKSIIHDLDFLEKSPQPRKKNLKNKINRRSSFSPDRRQSQLQNPFNINNSDKNSMKKLSTINNNNNFSKKNSTKKMEFSIFDKSTTLNINNQLMQSSESESIGEEEKEFLKFGFTNKKRIKKNRIRSMENNPKKLGFYEKNLFHKQKRDLAVEMLRNKINNEKQTEYKEVPELTKKTKNIINQKLNETKPLYQRIDEVMENKSNYIHKLKKFHNEDSKNIKFKDYNLMYDNTYMNELSNIDNLDYSHFSRNQNLSNSVKNNKSNFNNKYLNYNKSPDVSVNNTFLKMLNDTNIDLHNITSIPAMNTPNNRPNKAETSDNLDNFRIDENDENFSPNSKFNNQAYQEFMNNRKKNNESKQLNNTTRVRHSADDKKNTFYNDFPPEEYVKFDIQYPQRTMEWLRNKEHWERTKQKKLKDKMERMEKSESDKLNFLFKPKTNKNSGKIVNAKKNISRSMNMSQNLENEENKNFSNYNNDDNMLNENESLFRSQYNNKSPTEKTVFENLYNRRFDSEIKRKKILKETSFDFKPKINNDYKASVGSSGYLGDSIKNGKFNNIPAPKKINANTNSNKNEYGIIFEEMKNDLTNSERKEKIMEIKRQREEMKKNKLKGTDEDIARKTGKKSLMDMLDEVEKENQKLKNDENNHKRRKSETGQLYKLNIRSASAWDKNKENNVCYDQKFAKILTKVGMIKY